MVRRRTSGTKKTNEDSLTAKQRFAAFANIARTTYRAAPVAVGIKLTGSIISATVPLATAYFAAQTTTALAAGFAGDERAGERAMMYVIVTALLGVFMSVWSSVVNYINEFTSYKINAAVTDQLYEHFISLNYSLYDDKSVADRFDKAQNFATFFSRFF